MTGDDLWRAAIARVEELAELAEERAIPEERDLRHLVFEPSPPAIPSFRAVESALRWHHAQAAGCLLVVSGPPGTGKSCALAWTIVREGSSARYVSACDLFSPSLVDSALCDVQVLGVDDLGFERTVAPEYVAGFLARRHALGRCTLVTTHLTREAFFERYLAVPNGRRLAGRLTQLQGRAVGAESPGPGGLDWYVAVEGESLRKIDVRERLWRGAAR